MWGLEGVLGRDAGSSQVVFAPEGGRAVEPPNDLAEIHHQPGLPYGLPSLGSGIRVFPEAALEDIVVGTFASEVIEGAGDEFEQLAWGRPLRRADLRITNSLAVPKFVSTKTEEQILCPDGVQRCFRKSRHLSHLHTQR